MVIVILDCNLKIGMTFILYRRQLATLAYIGIILQLLKLA